MGGHSIAWDYPQLWSCMSIMTCKGLGTMVGIFPSCEWSFSLVHSLLPTDLLTSSTAYSHSQCWLCDVLAVQCQQYYRQHKSAQSECPMNVEEQSCLCYRPGFSHNNGCTLEAEWWGCVLTHWIHLKVTTFTMNQYYVFKYIPLHSSPSFYGFVL